jgi:hypothetical protein
LSRFEKLSRFFSGTELSNSFVQFWDPRAVLLHFLRSFVACSPG